jgi:hypothetical protein
LHLLRDRLSPITGEERRRKERKMSRCFTWFIISGLGVPNI